MTTAPKMSSTAIGSLPHHNVDAALAFSFRLEIPFLPQIPIRNPWEFMIAQALEGLPGLQVEEDGAVSLNVDIWHHRTHGLKVRLEEAFSQESTPDAFEAFEPSVAASSCWQPFLWELQEQKKTMAKVQIAGPMTAQWALKLNDGSTIDRHPDLANQIFRLVLARALAMSKRLKADGIQPILFLDEPSLYGLNLANPKHVMGLQELRVIVQTLKREGVQVGIHCCSNTQWSALTSLQLDILSIDSTLSLESLLQENGGKTLEDFVSSGGRLSLGVIPTVRSSVLHSLEVKDLFTHLMDPFGKYWANKPDLVKKVLTQAIYTPACGLALHSTGDAEYVLETLAEFFRFCKASL